MKLAYAHLPPIEIEMQVEECAQLLRALQHNEVGVPPVPHSQAPLPFDQPIDESKRAAQQPKARTQPRKQEQTVADKPVQAASASKPTPATQQVKSNQTEARGPQSADAEQARPYNGKVNRRHRVLEIFQDFQDLGEEALSIPQITAAFAERFPDEDSSNLDQVVRDMMNKTQQVVRVKRGFYALG